VAPIYTAEDIAVDPQLQALGTIRRMEDPDLGEIAVQGPLFRLSEADPVLAFTGRAHGADTDEVLAELGYDEAEIARLREEGAA
jgi:crotonobetainyl-CoA:carnitine CoA-transferase CaiB-like acyl-CoA transferase